MSKAWGHDHFPGGFVSVLAKTWTLKEDDLKFGRIGI